MTPSARTCAVPIAIGVLLLSACVSNPCDRDESDRCEGDVLWTCDIVRHGHGVDYAWAIREDCSESARVCVSIEGSPDSTADDDAICAESSQPSPDCADLLPSGFFCDGDTLVACVRGYISHRISCRACADSACVP